MDLGIRKALTEQQVGEKMASAFQDEFQKLSVSPGYLAARVISRGAQAGAPVEQIRSAAKQIATMQKLRQAGIQVKPHEMKKVIKGMTKKPPTPWKQKPKVEAKKPWSKTKRLALGAGAAVPVGYLALHRGDKREQVKAAMALHTTGDLRPPSGYAKGEDGAPGITEGILGQHQAVERKAEEARQVGEPKSDQLQKVLARIQGISEEPAAKAMAVSPKISAVVKSAAEKRRGRALPAGIVSGAGAGALIESLRRKKELSGIVKGLKHPGTSGAIAKKFISKARKGRLAGSIALGSAAGGGLGKALSKLRERIKTSDVVISSGDDVQFAYGPQQEQHTGTVTEVGVPYRGVGRAANVQFHDNIAGHPTALPISSLEKISAVSRVGYSKYFTHKMHERGITSPTQLSETDKKKFFQGVDTGWHSSHERFKGMKS